MMLVQYLKNLFCRQAAVPPPSQYFIEQLVAKTDPRLALLPGYACRLLPGVNKSLTYAGSLGHGLGNLMDLSRQAFTLDRRLGLIFSSPASLLAVLRSSEPLRDFFNCASHGDEAYALLVMQRTDTERYGYGQQDGEVCSDLAQTVVSFDHHQIVLPASQVEGLRANVAERAGQLLIQVIARRLESLNRERSDLARDLTKIRMRLAALERPQAVLIDALVDEGSLPTDRPGLLRLQASLQQRLQAIKGVSELQGCLQFVADMLETPAALLQIVPEMLSLDRMGVLQSSASSDNATMLLMEALMLPAQVVRRVLLPVRITRQTINDLASAVEAAEG